MSWDQNDDGLGEGGLISGYKLFMDDGIGGDFENVMNTVGYNADIKEYFAQNLTESLQYRFYLEAYNYNELSPSEISEIAYVYACDVPSFTTKPSKIQTSQESISINWNEPTNNGGCSI